MRDDRLGGIEQLRDVFEYLYAHNLLQEALKEKREAVLLWEQIKEIVMQIKFSNIALQDHIHISVDYGLALFKIVCHGWEVMINGFIGDKAGVYNAVAITNAISSYDLAWAQYDIMHTSLPSCSSLYNGFYFNLPGQPVVPGLDDSVNLYRSIKNDEPEKVKKDS